MPILWPASAIPVPAESKAMDVLKDVISAILMIGAVALIIGFVAALFMIIFNIATGVDEHLQE
jgi:hypothetical protein